MGMRHTVSQTIGPFFAYGLTPESYGRRGIAGACLLTDETQGQKIRIEGGVFDGAGTPVSDALVEVWQADSHGRYAHPADRRSDVPMDPEFKGFGRAGTDQQGRFAFETVKPGRVPGRGNTMQAPHISVVIFARGMLSHAFTRMYFSDEADANAADPVLGVVDDAHRKTLIAGRRERAGAVIYHFDIHLQGPNETVFFDA